jgi:O-antigen/teichoic acid export membrane protein
MPDKLSRSDRTIANLFTSIIAWGWPVALALVITPILIHNLGEDAYGMRGLIVTITGYFALLDLGLNSAGTKYLAEYMAVGDRSSVRELLGTTLSVYIVLGLVGGVLIWLTAPWAILDVFKVPFALQHESIWALRVAGLGFMLSMLIWWGTSIPTGLQRFDVFNWISVGFGTVTSLGSLCAVFLGQGLLGVVWATVLANLLAAIAYWIAARRLLPKVTIRPSFDWGMFKRTTMFGLWSVLFRVVGVMVGQLDRIFTAMWLGTAFVTYLIVPSAVASLVQQMSGKMMQIVFPMASEFSAVMDTEKLHRLILRSMNFTTVLAIGLSLPIFVLSQPLMTFWLGPDLAAHTAALLKLMVVAYCISCLTAAPSSILPGLGYPRAIFYAAVINSAVLLPAYFVMIRPLGIIGVAWAHLLTMGPVIAFYVVMLVRTTQVPWIKLVLPVFKPLLIAVLIGLIAQMLVVARISGLVGVILVGIVMAGVYGTAVWLAGTFDSSEKLMLRAFIRRRLPAFLDASRAKIR